MKKIKQTKESILKTKVEALEMVIRDQEEKFKIAMEAITIDNRKLAELLRQVATSLGISYSDNPFFTDTSILKTARDLVAYRKEHEGAISAGTTKDREMITMLREIVMWHVNPKTASQSKLIEEIKQRTGYVG